MKGLTLTQPWASAVAIGIKHIETRSWRTDYRGPLLIHAAKGFPAYAIEFARTELALGRGVNPIPRGAVVAVAGLVDVRVAEEVALDLGVDGGLERLYGDYSPGRWAWILEHVRVLDEPVPCRGALSLWTPPPDVLQAVKRQLS